MPHDFPLNGRRIIEFSSHPRGLFPFSLRKLFSGEIKQTHLPKKWKALLHGLREGNRFFGHIVIDIRVVDILRHAKWKNHSILEHNSLSKPQSVSRYSGKVWTWQQYQTQFKHCSEVQYLKWSAWDIFRNARFKISKGDLKMDWALQAFCIPSLHTRQSLWPNPGAERSNFSSGKRLI